MTLAYEALELCRGILETPEGDIVEIGSAQGKTTKELIKAAVRVKKHVYSIDPYPEELEGKAFYYEKGVGNYCKEEFEKNILNAGFDNITQFRTELAKCVHLLPKKLSMAFIDGLHELTYVLTDLSLIYPLVVPGGRVYIHDISWTIGQLTRTPENGVCHIRNVVRSEFKFQQIMEMPNMLRCIK